MYKAPSITFSCSTQRPYIFHSLSHFPGFFYSKTLPKSGPYFPSLWCFSHLFTSFPIKTSLGKVTQYHISRPRSDFQPSSNWTNQSLPSHGNSSSKHTTLPWFFCFVDLSLFYFEGFFSILCPANIDVPGLRLFSTLLTTPIDVITSQILNSVTMVWLSFTLSLHATALEGEVFGEVCGSWGLYTSEWMDRDSPSEGFMGVAACSCLSKLQHMKILQEDPHQVPAPYYWISQPPELWGLKLTLFPNAQVCSAVLQVESKRRQLPTPSITQAHRQLPARCFPPLCPGEFSFNTPKWESGFPSHLKPTLPQGFLIPGNS